MLPVGMTTTSICFFLVDMCRSILNMRALGGFFFFFDSWSNSFT